MTERRGGGAGLRESPAVDTSGLAQAIRAPGWGTHLSPGVPPRPDTAASYLLKHETRDAILGHNTRGEVFQGEVSSLIPPTNITLPTITLSHQLFGPLGSRHRRRPEPIFQPSPSTPPWSLLLFLILIPAPPASLSPPASHCCHPRAPYHPPIITPTIFTISE